MIGLIVGLLTGTTELNPFTYLKIVFYGGIASVLVYAAVLAWSTASNIADLSKQLTEAQHELALRDARETSMQRMLDRRDAAIGASKCTDQIKYWLTHPDEIPKPFQPFCQLGNCPP